MCKNHIIQRCLVSAICSSVFLWFSWFDSARVLGCFLFGRVYKFRGFGSICGHLFMDLSVKWFQKAKHFFPQGFPGVGWESLGVFRSVKNESLLINVFVHTWFILNCFRRFISFSIWNEEEKYGGGGSNCGLPCMRWLLFSFAGNIFHRVILVYGENQMNELIGQLQPKIIYNWNS